MLIRYWSLFNLPRQNTTQTQESMEHLKAAQRQLVKKQEELGQVQEELNTLQTKYNNTRIDRDKLEHRILQTTKRLDRARVLIEALSGEKDRWTDLVEGLNQAAPSLMGDTLVSTAAIGNSSCVLLTGCLVLYLIFCHI